MHMREFVYTLAKLTTVGLFFTGIPECIKIIRSSSTKETSFFPLMMMFIFSTLCLKQALLHSDKSLIIIHMFGAFCSLIYIIIYLRNTCRKKPIVCQLVFGVIVLLTPLIYVRFYATNHDDALFHLGFMCSAVRVLLYGSPLSAAVKVVNTQNTASMAITMSAVNFLLAAQLFAYGFLLKDRYTQALNATGVLLGLVQFTFFCKYSRKKSINSAELNISDLFRCKLYEN